MALAASMRWIILMVLVRGISALTPTVFTQVSQGIGGGLLNAIAASHFRAFGQVGRNRVALFGVARSTRTDSERQDMTKYVVPAVMALALATALPMSPALAKGCAKGAVVGGVAGHMAGHHTALGAAGGCAVGHHEANKNDTRDTKGSEQAKVDSQH